MRAEVVMLVVVVGLSGCGLAGGDRGGVGREWGCCRWVVAGDDEDNDGVYLGSG